MKSLKMKVLLLALIQMTAFTTLLAQSAPPETDAVFLHNGQEHRGLIVEQKPGESIGLWRSQSGDTLRFNMEDIEKIAKIAPITDTPSRNAEPVAFTNPGKTNTAPWAIALQVMTGGGDHSVAGAGAVVQRRLNNQRSWVGMGLSFVGDANSYGTHALGLVAHGSHEFSSGWKNRIGALAFMDLGYSFNLGGTYVDEATLRNHRYGNGMHLYTGLRFRVNVLRNAGVWFDLGFLRHTSMIRTVENSEKIGGKGWNMFNFRGSLFF